MGHHSGWQPFANLMGDILQWYLIRNIVLWCANSHGILRNGMWTRRAQVHGCDYLRMPANGVVERGSKFFSFALPFSTLFLLLYMLLLLWLFNTKGQWVSIATQIAVRWKSPPFIGGGWMLGAFMDGAGLGQSLSQTNPFIYYLTGPIFMPA